MNVPDLLLASFPPSVDALVDIARRQADDGILSDIARADYGEGVDEVLPELRAIRDTGVISSCISNQLMEVLLLTHYLNPEVSNQPPFLPSPVGLRGHQTRFFSCALIIHIESGLPFEHRRLSDSALANGIASAKHLGEDASMAFGRYLTWRLVNHDDRDYTVLFGIALLLLSTRLRLKLLNEKNLGEIVDWVLALESIMYNNVREIFPGYAGLWPLPLSVEAGFWNPILEEFEKEVDAIHHDDLRSDLILCSLLLNKREYQRLMQI